VLYQYMYDDEEPYAYILDHDQRFDVLKKNKRMYFEEKVKKLIESKAR